MECFWLSLFRHQEKQSSASGCSWSNGSERIICLGSVLSKVSSGFVIIITTILVAGLAAWLCPVDEENAKEEAHEA